MGFKEEKDEEGGVENEGQEEEEDGQGELEEGAIDVNLVLHLAKVQWRFPC